jgi:hypothetical protein
MAKAFIDLVQQVNDEGWVVGDCFQLKRNDEWIWRVALRDYAKRSDYEPGSVHAEHAVLEEAAQSCVDQMRRRIAENRLSNAPAGKTGKRTPGLPARDTVAAWRLTLVLADWCRSDARFKDVPISLDDEVPF